MFDFHEKRRLKNFLFSKLTLLVLAVIVAFFATNVWGVYQKARETKEKRDRLERELAELRTREETLRSELEQLETARGVEEEIRSKFDVVKEGEGVIVIVDPEEGEEQTAAVEQKSLWRRILDWF